MKAVRFIYDSYLLAKRRRRSTTTDDDGRPRDRRGLARPRPSARAKTSPAMDWPRPARTMPSQIAPPANDEPDVRLDDYGRAARHIHHHSFGMFARRCFGTLEPGRHVPRELARRPPLPRAGRGGERVGVRRLNINVPPRSLKSILVSVALPAWLLGRDPSTRIMCVSYSEALAKTFATQDPPHHAAALVPAHLPRVPADLAPPARTATCAPPATAHATPSASAARSPGAAPTS